MRKGIVEKLVSSFSKEKAIIQRKSVDVQKLNRLDISVSEADVRIFIHEEPNIEVVLETYEEGPALAVNHSGNTLDIIAKRISTVPHITFRTSPVRLSITVPRDIAESWSIRTGSGNVTVSEVITDSFYVTASSGDLEITDITLHKGNFKTSSGNILAREVKASELYFQTSSGKARLARIHSSKTIGSSSSGGITIMDLWGEILMAKASSGSVVLDNIKIKEGEFQCSSGNIKVNCLKSEKTSVKSSSGTISLLAIHDGNLEAKASSGNVTIAFENKKINATFDVRVGSGKISTNIPMNMLKQSTNTLEGLIGDGDNLIQLKTSSGNVRIS